MKQRATEPLAGKEPNQLTAQNLKPRPKSMKLWAEFDITEEQVKSLRLPWLMYQGHATIIYPDVEGLREKITVEVVERDDEYSYLRFPVFIDD